MCGLRIVPVVWFVPSLAFVVYVLEATRGDGKWRQLKAVHKTISLSAPYAGYDELGSLVLLVLCSISVYKSSIP